MGLIRFRSEVTVLARPVKLLRLVKRSITIHADNGVDFSVPDFVPESWVEQFSTDITTGVGSCKSNELVVA